MDLLLDAAPAFGIEGSRCGDGAARVTLPLIRPSGAIVSYHLELREVARSTVWAREQPHARRLPAHCPERHINRDGWFCMYWQEGEEEAWTINDADAAADWWILLTKYLNRQETVGVLRRWVGEARAHGDAARHQRIAEQIAARFGPTFVQDLRESRLRIVRRQRHGRDLLELSRGGTVIARVSATSSGRIPADLPCPCDEAGSARPIGQCNSHRDDLKKLMLAIHRWHEAERTFYEQLLAKRVRCCGTMLECPLRCGGIRRA
ncbi:MAG TPA: E2 domain-associated cysteine-rich protein [Steroidobacter sp.]